MAEVIKIDGLRAVSAALQKLGDNVAKSVLRGGVSAAAKVVRDETKRRAPVDTGRLKRAVAFGRARWECEKGREVANVFVRQAKNGAAGQKRVEAYGKFDAYYGRWVEFGTSDTPAQPFMRPAWDATKASALEAMVKYYADRLPLEIQKVGFKAGK